jgi:hypothetical protein
MNYSNNELSFCVHSLSEIEREEAEEEDYKDLNIITFCPIQYWKEHGRLPDFYFADGFSSFQDNNQLPEGYSRYTFVEECQWCSKKSIEEISKELTSIGFVENEEMKIFLSSLY